MAVDHSSDRWVDQNDPFGEEFYFVPPDEVIRARAEYVLQDNRDALRHFVELVIWEALDNPDHLKAIVTLLWNWNAIDPEWLAEAAFMNVADVRDIAESQPILVFPCLDCGTDLAVRNRRHRIQMQSSLEDHCQDEAGTAPPINLLCEACRKQREDHAEQQRRIDEARREAMLSEYRARPYAERRSTQEWAILKRQVHRRDGYRCRLCGRDDLELHVHHRSYANYAQERLEDVITLCSVCHYHFHFRSEAS
jgi:5-methylcytosine-specific restriction endonuclease McrA